MLLEDGLCGNSPIEQLDDLGNQLAAQKKLVAELENNLRQQRKTAVSPDGKTEKEIIKEGEYIDTQIRGLDDAIKNARKDMTAAGVSAEQKQELKNQIEARDNEKKEWISKKHELGAAVKELKDSYTATEKEVKNAEKIRDELQKEYDKKKKEVDIIRNISVSDFDALSPEEQKMRAEGVIKEYETDKNALLTEKKQIDDQLIMITDLNEDEKELLRKKQKDLTNDIKDVDNKILQVQERLKEAQKKRSENAEKKERNENTESYKMLQIWKTIQGDSFPEDKVTFGMKAGTELFVSDGADSDLLG